MSTEAVHIFGIRHHGPGSARSLLRALEALEPQVILIEGPPDAEEVLPLAAHAQIIPPVALLVYRPDDPKQAAFYPFAEFSPEWQAIRFGLGRGIPVRFMDLPQHFRLIDTVEEPKKENADDAEATTAVDEQQQADDEQAPPEPELCSPIRRDPLGCLAQAAGYTDGERWWDHVVESRQHDGDAIFAAVREAMATLREDLPGEDDLLERRREAFMRRTIRSAMKEGHERIAVVCGAWHAPALNPQHMPPAKDDDALLRGLTKVKTQAAWTPWTYERLSFGSGYGAGVISPAWYELLWSGHNHIVTRWMTSVAQLMREQDLDASSAHVIEGVRLAEALATMRHRSLPGLEELDEAALTVICGGEQAPMRLIRRKLIIGERLGAVPEDAPMAPLQRDLASLQKSLRLPASSAIKDYDLDLRKPIDLQRSHLLRRLRLLSVPWGEPSSGRTRSTGTFRESWQVRWQPEFAVALIDASRWGNTIAAAASARAVHAAAEAQTLTELTELLDDALLADLPEAVAALIDAIQSRAAKAADLPQLMSALPPLARIIRYGNVRGTDATLVTHVVDGVAARVSIGLPGACASLNDDAAAQMFNLMVDTNAALQLLDNEPQLTQWHDALTRVADHASAHRLVVGRAARMLHDARRDSAEDSAKRMSLALSAACPPAEAAAWVEGFLRGSGMILIHDAELWSLLDAWVRDLQAQAFDDLLPLLRRTFSTFEAPERRQMGERLKAGETASTTTTPGIASDFDEHRAAKVLPVLQLILGGGNGP